MSIIYNHFPIASALRIETQRSRRIEKTGVTADRDKIEFRSFKRKLESRPAVTRLSLGCLILV